MATVCEILIAASPAHLAECVEKIEAIPGKGLAGDRYANGNGTFSKQPQQPDGELTLIQKEHLDAFAAATGLKFSGRDARRNIVTSGIDLNAFVGREFSIGSVRIRALRLCEPCNYLAKQTSGEVLRGLLHKGGIRAQILTAGEIKVGAEIISQPV